MAVWAVHPNEPSGFHGRKAILNHASALVTTCPLYVNWHLRTLSITSPIIICLAENCQTAECWWLQLLPWTPVENVRLLFGNIVLTLGHIWCCKSSQLWSFARSDEQICKIPIIWKKHFLFCCCCNVKSSVTQSQQCKCGGDLKIFCVWCVYYTYHGCMHACLLLHFAEQMNILSTLTCFFAFCYALCVANQTKAFLDLGRGGQGRLMSFSACLEPQCSLRFCPLLCCCFCIYIYCLKKYDIYKSDDRGGTFLASKIWFYFIRLYALFYKCV